MTTFTDPLIPRANVLGTGVHALDMAASIERIATAVEHRRKGYVCLCSVHGIMEARRDTSLAGIFDRALLTAPDGMPLVWVGRVQGLTQIQRVFGPDLMAEVFGVSQRRAWTHFLYGGAPGVASRLRRSLQGRYPGARVVGTFEPPFRPLNDNERDALVRQVSDAKPDIFWVGLSTPKQERFMAEYLNQLDCALMVGVGAAFDYHTGRLHDSPHWVKRCGLQWAHRLLQEPSRLWRRYLRNNPEFLFRIALQFAGWRTYPLANSCPVFLPSAVSNNDAD